MGPEGWEGNSVVEHLWRTKTLSLILSTNKGAMIYVCIGEVGGITTVHLLAIIFLLNTFMDSHLPQSSQARSLSAVNDSSAPSSFLG
jgi:hypothetical protein